VASLSKELLEKIDYQSYLKQTSSQAEEKWQNAMELIRLAEDFDEYEKGDLNQFLEKISLFQEGDRKIK